jgi:hypothetical protein
LYGNAQLLIQVLHAAGEQRGDTTRRQTVIRATGGPVDDMWGSRTLVDGSGGTGSLVPR